jgi:hypothetical protein
LPVPDRSLRGTMPFNASQGLGNEESKLVRAVKALPFSGITAAAVYYMYGVRKLYQYIETHHLNQWSITNSK